MVYAEQRFVLAALARVEPDLADAVLAGAGDFAAGEWAPLDRIGDQIGARLLEGRVTMPAGVAAAYRAYVDGGWGTIGAPPEFGGQGLPFALAAAVLELLGTANMGLTLAPVLNAGAIEALRHHGTPEQQATYLPKLATGEWTATMNLTEPHAGSDVGALRARAERRADGTWSISGTKIFISFGDHDMTANIAHLVLARTPGAPPGTKGLSLFLAPKFRLDTDGTPTTANDIRVASIEHKMGLHMSPTCVMSFGENGGCIGELIGDEGGGMRAMFTMMNNARLNVGVQGVQAAEAATRRALAYASQRIQSARAGGTSREPVAIIEHPDVRRMLMRMQAQTQAARALIYYAAGQVDAGTAGDVDARDRVDLLTPLAKSHCTDVGCEVASLGIQVHGGAGYIEETGAAQHWRDARITPIYEGTNGIQAADLVMRKLTLKNGSVVQRLFDDMRAGAEDQRLIELIGVCETLVRGLSGATADDRLAASAPLLTMMAVAVCGWLMEIQHRAALAAEGDAAFMAMKRAVTAFYVRQVLPEALGLQAAASEPALGLYGGGW